MKFTTFEEQLEQHGYLVWKNVGVSMRPLLREGRDLIKIEPCDGTRCRKYDTVLFCRDRVSGRGKYVLHRILRCEPDGTYWIVGDNCAGGEIVRPDQILGVLTEIVRDGRVIRVTDRGYRCYVHLWCDAYPIRFFLLRCRSRLARAAHRLCRLK